jgi:hypothetical protein
VQVANPPVEPPTLLSLQFANETNYKPDPFVLWNEEVFAWSSRFVNRDDESDTISYLFNTQEEGENLLLELLDSPNVPEDQNHQPIKVADLENERDVY